ncbi:hypothetical protein [Burkholderia cepacia]|uniref:hypothetical protein n=1 Tax=Burkholderia cepacia TaxID=292 RepID=UPI001F2FFD74|nr:hypothetical protein [Burkholderia cepacia]MCE4125801.1 hypothetical protein [Burkholderia cepacia]
MRASSQFAGSAGFGFLETILIGNVPACPPKQDYYSAECGTAGDDVDDEERVHGNLSGLTRSDDSAAVKRSNDMRRRLASQLAERDQLIRSTCHHENSDAAVQTS